MNLNMFEGARRIALVFGVLWVGGCVAYVVLNEPHARMVFSIAGVGDSPVKGDDCGPDDAARYRYREEGMPIGVTVCFTAQQANDGRMLVPYPSKGLNVRMPDGTIIEGVPEGLSRAEIATRLRAAKFDVEKLLVPQEALPPTERASEPKRFRMATLGERWSDEVRSYADGAAAAFKFPASAVPEAEQRLWEARVAQWKTTALVMFAVLAAGWLVVTTIGWVVRGFLGIPRGQDARSG